MWLSDGVNSYGIVGEVVSHTTSLQLVHIGDIVKVEVGLNKLKITGLVANYRGINSVYGLANTDISKMKVLEIIKSHKQLSVGDVLQGGIKVVESIE